MRRRVGPFSCPRADSNGIIERMYDIDVIKAERRFGMYRYAHTDLELNLAAIVDKGYENALERHLTLGRRMVCIAEAMQLRTLAEFAAARPGATAEEPFSRWAADEL